MWWVYNKLFVLANILPTCFSKQTCVYKYHCICLHRYISFYGIWTWMHDQSEDVMWKPHLSTNIFAGRLMPYLQPRWDNHCCAKGASGRTKITWFRVAAIAATTWRTATPRGSVGDFWCCGTASPSKVEGLGELVGFDANHVMFHDVFLRICAFFLLGCWSMHRDGIIT